jgi:RHS repeat-associated protein
MRDGESNAGTDTGQDYFNARYFWANTARFTSPDAPFADQRPEDGQSWNMYAYVRNNPIKFTDPNGQRCVDGRTVDVGPDEDGNACFDTTVTAEPEKDSEADDPPTGFFYGWLWLHGLLPRSVYYPETSQGTEDMKRSSVVQRLRNKYINEGCPDYDSQRSGHFEPWAESARNGIVGNTTQFEVGGFVMTTATSGDRAMTSYTVRNTTGWSSLFGVSTWGPSVGIRENAWDVQSGLGANVEQVFVWKESNPCH